MLLSLTGATLSRSPLTAPDTGGKKKKKNPRQLDDGGKQTSPTAGAGVLLCEIRRSAVTRAAAGPLTNHGGSCFSAKSPPVTGPQTHASIPSCAPLTFE